MPGSDPKRPPSSIDQPQRPLSTDMSRVCIQAVTAVEHRETYRALTAPLDREELDRAPEPGSKVDHASGSGSGLRPHDSDDSPDSFHGATPWLCPCAPNGYSSPPSAASSTRRCLRGGERGEPS